MSPTDILCRIKIRRKRALLAWRDARIELKESETAFYAFLKEHPPKTFRLQEAYRNPDGTYSTPHWDQVGQYADHNMIDGEELDYLIGQEGEWYEVYDNQVDDPRPGCRRVIEVTW